MPEFEAQLPLHVDSTMIAAFRSCPRRYYNEFVLGLRPKNPSVHLHAGAAFASALEHFYNRYHIDGVDPHRAELEAIAVLSDEYGDFVCPDKEAKSLDRMIEALKDYLLTYPPKTDHVQPYFVEGFPTFEFSFSIPLDFKAPDGKDFPLHPVTGDPFMYVGRFDMLGTYNGVPCVKDDKTTKSASYNWAEQWKLRSQFMGYVWACQYSGLPLDQVVIRGCVIQKTQIRQLEAICSYPDHLLQRWLILLRRDVERIAQYWNEGYFDFNYSDVCTSYGGCTFGESCVSENPAIWLDDYVVNRWNPLAKNPDTRDVMKSITERTNEELKL